MAYKKLFGLSLVSFVIMYAVMFLNVDALSHVYLSMNRVYMALLMVAPMQIMMVAFMGSMYRNKKTNLQIIAGWAFVFVAAFICLRNQVLIGDRQYMKGMIPHHSSAIMTSKHADIRDPEVKKLSEQIIRSQEREISEMKEMLKRLEAN